MGAGNSAPSWTEGKIGGALKFDGSNDYTEITNSTSLNLYNATGITIEAWIKLNDISSTQGIIGEWDGGVGGGRQFVLDLISSGGNLYAGFSVSGTGVNRASRRGDTVLNINQWYHIVGIWRNNATMSIYVNGVNQSLVDVSSTEGIPTSLKFSTRNICIGTKNNNNVNNCLSSIQYLNGLIDNVRIFNYARTPAQIAWDYNRGAPIAHWKLDECQGETAYDSIRVGATIPNGTITIGTSGSQNTAGNCGISNTAAAWYNGRTGKYNSSLKFDGTDDYVEISDNNILDITSELTISAWVKINSTKNLNYGGVAKYANMTGYLNQRAYGFWFIANDTKVNATVSDDGTYNGGHYTTVISNSTLDIGSWNLVTVIYKPSTYLRIYINGKLDAETTNGVISSIYNSSAPLWIGINYDNTVSNRDLEGQIDDIRIYNYALTNEQVKQVFNQGSAVRYGPSEGSP